MSGLRDAILAGELTARARAVLDGAGHPA
jgi:hypothetical protein